MRSRTLWVVGALLLVAMVVHLAALVITGGPWTGPVSLRKPAAFAETGWLACWSVALILPAIRTRAWQRHVITGATILFGVGETAIIGFQAWRGVPSHYNFSTPLDAALMRGGAAGTAAIFLAAMVVLLVAVARSTASPASVRLGVLAGTGLLVAGCAIGLVMIFNNSGVYQGSIGAGFSGRPAGYLGPSPATVGPDYLVLKPSTDGGDLVLLHAIGVHGLVLLAVPAVLLARTALSPASCGWSPSPWPRSAPRSRSWPSTRSGSCPGASSLPWRWPPSPDASPRCSSPTALPAPRGAPATRSGDRSASARPPAPAPSSASHSRSTRRRWRAARADERHGAFDRWRPGNVERVVPTPATSAPWHGLCAEGGLRRVGSLDPVLEPR